MLRFLWLLALHLGCLLGLSLFSPAAQAQAVSTISKPVTDLAEVLEPDAEIALSQKLVDHHASGKAQIAVLTVRTTNVEAIEDFAHRIASAWRGGEGGKDNGVLVVLAVDDRRSRIEVGYGLEDRISDVDASLILSRATPELRTGDYGEALRGITDDLIAESSLPGGESQLAAREPKAYFPVILTWAVIFASLFGRGLYALDARLRRAGVPSQRWIWALSLLFVVATGTLAGLWGHGWTLYLAAAVGLYGGWRVLWHPDTNAFWNISYVLLGWGACGLVGFADHLSVNIELAWLVLPCGHALGIVLCAALPREKSGSLFSKSGTRGISAKQARGTAARSSSSAVTSRAVSGSISTSSPSSSSSSSSSTPSFDWGSSSSSSSSSSSYSGGGGSFGGGGASGSW